MKASLVVWLVIAAASCVPLSQVWINEAGTRQIAIRLSPRVIMEGGAFWLTCLVPRDARNRLLDYGVVNLREHSQRQLDGLEAPMTFQTLVEHVPCGTGPAYCAVIRSDGHSDRAVKDFLISGCES